MLEGTKGPFNQAEVILIECDYSTRLTFADVLWLEAYWHECGVWVFAAHSTDGSWTDAEADTGRLPENRTLLSTATWADVEADTGRSPAGLHAFCHTFCVAAANDWRFSNVFPDRRRE